jgi:hypothetical protein
MRSAPLGSELGRWDERDLIRRLCHALDIAKLAVQQLATHGYTDPKNPAKSVRSEKIVSETAVLLFSASSLRDHPQLSARMMNVAEQLIPHARSKRMLLGLCLEPAVAWDYALAHVCLSRLGYRDSQFDELLGQSLSAQAHSGRERVPHRMLEQEWIAKHSNESRTGQRCNDLHSVRSTILNQSMDLLNGTRDDIYAFTHALMYVADFGLSPSPLPRKRPVILAEAEAVLGRCLDEQDYDLCGEILLSWPLTGKSWSPPAAFAFRVLAHVEDRAYFLPTPSTRINELKALEGSERTNYLVATAYHTAFVMGLVCAASLQKGAAPPASIRTANARRGATKQILEILDSDGSCPHWRDEFHQLANPEADPLAGFLVNIALRRRAVSRDFEGLRRVLELAYDLDLANGPAASQAAELLNRITTYAQIACGPQSTADSVPIPLVVRAPSAGYTSSHLRQP